MPFIIFDTEYTSWKGCLENGWTGNRKKEIVQISALKVSADLEVIAEFNALCKPQINPVLSDYFSNLTHITNEQIKQFTEPFKNVYDNFVTFTDSHICYSHGWGGNYFDKSDGEIMEENLSLYHLENNKNLKYRNIAPVFKQLYNENKINVTSQSSGQIVEILGLKEKLKTLDLDIHNALYDVYSILEGLKYFYPRSAELLNIFENDRKI